MTQAKYTIKVRDNQKIHLGTRRILRVVLSEQFDDKETRAIADQIYHRQKQHNTFYELTIFMYLPGMTPDNYSYACAVYDSTHRKSFITWPENIEINKALQSADEDASDE